MQLEDEVDGGSEIGECKPADQRIVRSHPDRGEIRVHQPHAVLDEGQLGFGGQARELVVSEQQSDRDRGGLLAPPAPGRRDGLDSACPAIPL
jgi:hypothetical protein